MDFSIRQTAAKGLSSLIPIIAGRIRRLCAVVVFRTEIWPPVQSIAILAGELSRNIAILIYNKNPRLSLSMKGLPRINRKSLGF